MVKPASVHKLIEKFRNSAYFIDVVHQSFRCTTALIQLRGILDKPDEELKQSLREVLTEGIMLEPRTVGPIIAKNSIEALRAAFAITFGNPDSPWEVFERVQELEGAGVFFSSYMLSIATEGDYIVYHDDILNGLGEILPSLADMLLPVRDAETYFTFDLACRALLKSYGFNSYWEIHEFLWHGHDTGWTFG